MSTAFQFVSLLILGLLTSNLHAQKNSDAARAHDSVSLNGTAAHSGKVVYSKKTGSPEVPEGRPILAHR